VDAALYDDLRTALLAAGATQLDLELAAQALVSIIVGATEQIGFLVPDRRSRGLGKLTRSASIR